MSKEKQIEEMVTELAKAHHEMDVAWTNHLFDKEKFPKPNPEHTILAEHLYNAGYRKQKEGRWKKIYDKAPRYVCTACNHLFNNKEYKYCPNCGAKMKGGE